MTEQGRAAARLSKLSAQVVASASAPAVAGVNVSSTGAVGSRNGDDVVIVSALRTAIGKARRGNFRNTTPDTLLKAVLVATLEATGIDPNIVDDIVVGNVQLGGAYAGPARMAMFTAGFNADTAVMAVNRQCSSGLQAVANVAASIRAGYSDVGIGAGVESMSKGGGPMDAAPPPIDFEAVGDCKLARDCMTPMGTTSETVAERYGITRAMQDAMAADSHRKALEAQASGHFAAEIVPVTTVVEDRETGEESTVTVSADEGPRAGSTVERLAKLRTVFKEDGTTTAGNASQVSDGAAAVLLMRRSHAAELGLPVMGSFRGYKVVGVAPDEMGVGPAFAIPALLSAIDGVGIDDVDVFEINEAFASQAVYCVEKLGIPMAKVSAACTHSSRRAACTIIVCYYYRSLLQHATRRRGTQRRHAVRRDARSPPLHLTSRSRFLPRVYVAVRSTRSAGRSRLATHSAAPARARSRRCCTTSSARSRNSVSFRCASAPEWVPPRSSRTSSSEGDGRGACSRSCQSVVVELETIAVMNLIVLQCDVVLRARV